ncbi:alpha/beta fold hydrolase [Serinibacter arcticus]|uniref:Haloalkane dehalogenase-like protein / AMP-dependent synthetase/ligase in alkane synthesis cluster n=1 Tax=Serinibacter arcticus TaxID=1655435 RepID=A0A4Z1E5C6_9MICO|nr:alpha/beta fold hydrolase [Serinibacter arcticus]TGO06500.1 Haloalkane dehalogenase-like protein / AMP-dependent synthetase/ligase in alkane synthesis cluster [Serinibacter arcticus]
MSRHRSAGPAATPHVLDGLDPAWSRLIEVPDAYEERRESNTWHVLDSLGRLEELGAQPVGTILCVHGNPTWSYLWRRLVAASTEQARAGGAAWRVVAVDQLGMGFSQHDSGSDPLRTLEDRVADLGRLTDALGLTGRVVTLGHDWGGVVSLGWALDHPDLLAGVAVLNTAVHQPETDPIPAPLRLTLQGPVLGPATQATRAFLETTLSLADPPLRPEVREGFRAPYRSADRRRGIRGFVADIPVEETHPSRTELDRIAEGLRDLAAPALALWGPRDPIFSDRYLDDLADRLPQLDVHRFEGAGHMIAEEVDYASAVLTWLGDLEEAHGPEARPTAEPAVAEPAAWTTPPLWHHLESQRASRTTALVEMAPPVGTGPRTVSWRALARRVDEIGAGLLALGVRPGDRISLLVPPGADLTAILYACLRVGAVAVVADAGLGVRGLTRAVRGARPTLVIGAVPGLSAARALGWPGERIAVAPLPRALARTLGARRSLRDVTALGAQRLAGRTLAELAPTPGPRDTAAVLFTSGSTGPAKGVVYTHGQLAAVRDALAATYGIGPDSGLVAGFAPFALLGPALGARSVTPDMDVTSPGTLTARATAAAVDAVGAATMFLSPAAIAGVVATADALTPAERDALTRVGTFLSAGAPVPLDLLTAAEALMPNAEAHTPYGMTEGLLLTDVSADEIRAVAHAADSGVCVGRPIAPVSLRLSPLDEQGRATGALVGDPGVTGEIVVAAPHLKDRYDKLWLTERASRRTTGEPAPEGLRWHRTGDVGHLDDGGRVWIEGRLAHVIVTADGVLTPVGPESAVAGSPLVARAAVVGIGPVGTQQVVAVVETVPGARRPGLAPEGVADDVRARCPVPLAAVLVVRELPTDVRHNSKIDRGMLSGWAAGVLAGGRVTAP